MTAARINFITYYAPNLYEQIGLSREVSTLVGGFQALEYFIIFLGARLPDRACGSPQDDDGW
jgi:hypothetical protein